MNDIDQTIRAELEHLVPVTSQADWEGVLAASARPPSPRRRHALWIALAALVAVGAGAAAVGKVPWWQRGSHPQAVIEDVFRDGKLGREWNCASLREAIQKLPEDVVRYSDVGRPIYKAAATRCAAALETLTTDSTEREVRTALGQPDRMNSCWLYSWKPIVYGATRTDARICFERDGTLIQRP